jgi:hypothetical protein
MESKPWTTQSLVLDDVKSQATRSQTQAVIFLCGVPRAMQGVFPFTNHLSSLLKSLASVKANPLKDKLSRSRFVTQDEVETAKARRDEHLALWIYQCQKFIP